MADEPEQQPETDPSEPGGGVEIGDSVIAKIAHTACRDIFRPRRVTKSASSDLPSSHAGLTRSR